MNKRSAGRLAWIVSGAAVTLLLETGAYYWSIAAGNYSLYLALILVFVIGQSVAGFFGNRRMFAAIAATSSVALLWALNYQFIEWLRFGFLGESKQPSLWYSFSTYYSWLGAAAVLAGVCLAIGHWISRS